MKTSTFAIHFFVAVAILCLPGLAKVLAFGDSPAHLQQAELQEDTVLTAPAELPPAVQEQEPPPPPTDPQSPSDVPVPPVAAAETPLPTAPVLVAPVLGGPCDACCCAPCCCPPVWCPPPPPICTTICVQDPCTGCSYNVCIYVPACCVDQAPVVQWRNGLLGRRVAMVCWPCCDKRVKVVVTLLGHVRVWG